MASTRRTAWHVAFVVALAAQLVALYWPRVAVDGFPQDSDKVVHLLLFGVPAYLGVVAFGRWWPALVLVAHAPVSELLQGALLPGRSSTPADAIADLAGVALGVVLALRTRRCSTRARTPDAPPRPSEDVTIER